MTCSWYIEFIYLIIYLCFLFLFIFVFDFISLAVIPGVSVYHGLAAVRGS